MSCNTEIKKLDITLAERARIFKDESFLNSRLNTIKEELSAINTQVQEGNIGQIAADRSFDNPDKFLDYVETLIPTKDQVLMADVFHSVRKNSLHKHISFPQQVANMIAGIYTHRTGNIIDWSGASKYERSREAEGVSKGLEITETGREVGGKEGVVAEYGKSAKGVRGTREVREGNVPISDKADRTDKNSSTIAASISDRMIGGSTLRFDYTWMGGAYYTPINGAWTGKETTFSVKNNTEEEVLNALIQKGADYKLVSTSFIKSMPKMTRRTFLKSGAAIAAWAGLDMPGVAHAFTYDLRGAIKGDKNPTTRSILKHIANNTDNPKFKELANWLIKETTHDIPIYLGDMGTSYGQFSFNDGEYGSITLDSKEGVRESTILHEALHSVIYAKYHSLDLAQLNPNVVVRNKAKKQMDDFRSIHDIFRENDIVRAVRKRYLAGETISGDDTMILAAYGDIEELFVRALTNKRFQEVLASLEVQQGGIRRVKLHMAPKTDAKYDTIWDAIIAWIKTLFDGKPLTFLDAVYPNSQDLLKAMESDVADYTARDLVRDIRSGESTPPKLEAAQMKKPVLTIEELVKQTEDRADVALAAASKATPIKSKMREMRDIASDAFRATRSRIAELSPKVAEILQRYENGVHQDMKRYKESIDAYAKSYSKLDEKKKMMWADAVYSGKEDLKNELASKFHIDIVAFDKSQAELRDRAVAVGLVDHLVKGYYHHRKIKDHEGLMMHLHEKNPEIANMIDVEVDRRSKKFAREGKGFGKADRNQVISDMLNAGYGNVIKKPSGSKSRMLSAIPATALQFYADPISSAVEGTYDMTEAVNIREKLGVTGRKKELVKLRSLSRKIDALYKEESTLAKTPANRGRLDKIKIEKDALRIEFNDMGDKLEASEDILETSIATVIGETVAKKDQQKVIDLLRGRIKQRGAYGAVSAARNIMLMATLGNPLSAITQLGDFAFIIYDTGILNTMSAVSRSIAEKVKGGGLIRKHFDFGHSISDFTSSSSTAKMLDTVLTYSGLKTMDLFGKEVHLQASLKKWGDIAKSGDKARFFDKWERYLGEDTQATFDDLKNGKETERVIFMLFNALADKQPISLSELPQAYLKGGNLRAFYMLKTFSIKALNVIYDEAAIDIRKGNYAKGAVRITYLTLLLAACGAGADEIKELLLTMTGSKVNTKDTSYAGMMKSLNDNTVDNMFQLFLLNRYSMAKGIKQDRFVSNVIDGVLPPVRFADHFIADIFGLINGEGFKAKTVQDIPLIGKFVTGRFDVNKEMKLSMSKKDIYTRVVDEGVDAVSSQVAAHNRAAREAGFPDMLIKGKDLRSKYRTGLKAEGKALKEKGKLERKRKAFRDSYDEDMED